MHCTPLFSYYVVCLHATNFKYFCFIFLGGKDGPVGFADFVYKHIVPACFLAPLKETFDLTDAQTVLVCMLKHYYIGKMLNAHKLI